MPEGTAEEFERAYAERSGVTVEWLRRHRRVLPCACGEDWCEGWQMVPHEEIRACALELARKVRDA